MRVVSNFFLHLAASAMLCVGLALSGCAGVETAPASPSLKQRIEAAHTRADHMVLEAYYNARGEDGPCQGFRTPRHDSGLFETSDGRARECQYGNPLQLID